MYMTANDINKHVYKGKSFIFISKNVNECEIVKLFPSFLFAMKVPTR